MYDTQVELISNRLEDEKRAVTKSLLMMEKQTEAAEKV
jgi:hypothetical protein